MWPCGLAWPCGLWLVACARWTCDRSASWRADGVGKRRECFSLSFFRPASCLVLASAFFSDTKCQEVVSKNKTKATFVRLVQIMNGHDVISSCEVLLVRRNVEKAKNNRDRVILYLVLIALKKKPETSIYYCVRRTKTTWLDTTTA